MNNAPKAATRIIEHLAADLDPAIALKAARTRSWRSGLAILKSISTAIAVDPQSWTLAHFTLWAAVPPDAQGIRYEVLHLSAPHLHSLAAESTADEPTPAHAA